MEAIFFLNQLTIALDGPAGAGKSTVAKLVAERLQLLYVDTGAMYRALTLKALRKQIPLRDELSLTQLANSTEILLTLQESKYQVWLDGEEVTQEIREPDVTLGVSEVSAVPGVRLRMVELQRELARGTSVVMDGRDIGSFVLPDAKLKIFLTASIEERARRRCEDLKLRGHQFSESEIQADIERRDKYDSNREFAPLIAAKDAIHLDTTGLTIDQVVEKIVSLASPYVR